jgi:hypothetical protein
MVRGRSGVGLKLTALIPLQDGLSTTEYAWAPHDAWNAFGLSDATLQGPARSSSTEQAT